MLMENQRDSEEVPYTMLLKVKMSSSARRQRWSTPDALNVSDITRYIREQHVSSFIKLPIQTLSTGCIQTEISPADHVSEASDVLQREICKLHITLRWLLENCVLLWAHHEADRAPAYLYGVFHWWQNIEINIHMCQWSSDKELATYRSLCNCENTKGSRSLLK